ncbi:SusE domain-containing protein [Formosa sp. PL04]|uniref:SusE domain-containing protein n=1 Tax=Formosa sp. PL04 TaxID=3081755 RepID=UPI0029824A78|nr:SusE domain-containing protein [Formosa sp. PL04]MDW5288002.1 SusE domain-containing protein [Formosa sp. PL04]
MKNIVSKLFSIMLVAITLYSCSTDDEITVLNATATTDLITSADDIVLLKENEEAIALTLTWTQPDYGYSAIADYNVYFDVAGNNFQNAIIKDAGSKLEYSLTTKDLNTILQTLEIVPNTETVLEVKIESVVGTSTIAAVSNISNLTVTGYANVLDLVSVWGLVGSATVNGWDGPDMPFYKTNVANIFNAYVTLTDGELKIRANNSWDLNYGDTGDDGTLEEGGDNILVKAGTYKVTFNEATLTYKIEPYTWGLVGSATPNGWDGPDTPLTYDPTSDQWRAIVPLTTGDMKFRKNNDWAFNYGDDGNDGALEDNGANIPVTAGNYLVTLNLNDLTYTLEPIEKLWGIVGSATPNGWDGPDTVMNIDYTIEGVWYLYQITLTDGEMKFRANNDWNINYGDDDNDGSLEDGGGNITVEAGVYDIVLDLSDTSNPTYTLTK